MSLVPEQIARYTKELHEACGPDVLCALKLSDIEDIVLNPDGRCWKKCRSDGWTVVTTIDSDRAYKIVNTVAAMKSRSLNESKPWMETTFPINGSQDAGRFAVAIPPHSSEPIFALRVKSSSSLRFSDYAEQGAMTRKGDPLNVHRTATSFIDGVVGLAHDEILRRAVLARRNILYVGPTGSGKTTLADTALTEIGILTPQDRVVYIEDTPELVCNIANSADLATVDATKETPGIDMLACVRHAMRLRPKRIVVGEVRGVEANAMLQAWLTGHSGIATVHADNALAGIMRVESLSSENGPRQRDLIAQSVHLVVFLDEEPSIAAGQKVREVLAVTGYDSSEEKYTFTQL